MLWKKSAFHLAVKFHLVLKYCHQGKPRSIMRDNDVYFSGIVGYVYLSRSGYNEQGTRHNCVLTSAIIPLEPAIIPFDLTRDHARNYVEKPYIERAHMYTTSTVTTLQRYTTSPSCPVYTPYNHATNLKYCRTTYNQRRSRSATL